MRQDDGTTRTGFENLRVYQEELTPKLSAYITSIRIRQRTTNNKQLKSLYVS